MVYKKRIIAPIAFAWTLVAAGMAAVALTAGPVASTAIQLQDVQVGERGNQTRIALLCDSPCVLEKRGPSEFLLRGVNASMELDLSTRTENVTMLTATPSPEGAYLRISTIGVVEYANTKNCTIGGRPAACIDLFFVNSAASDPAGGASPIAVAAAKIAPAPRLKTHKDGPSANHKMSAIAAPILREGSPERMMTFARLTPPERLSPSPDAILAKVQPIAAPRETPKPIIRTVMSITPVNTSLTEAPRRFSFNRQIAQILRKDLTSIHCATAELTLQADAWALDAMVDAGLCAAMRGDVEEADAMLARLLEYTPDNYEALVGRALIAAQAKEKGVARKYFQDALNALPPIAESNRIVQAMSAL